MRNDLFALALLLVGFLATSDSARAHHGYTAFDTKTEVTLTGTVSEFHFVNPDCVIEFEVKGEDGEVHKWQGELTSANRLAPRGWSAASLKAGDAVTVTGYRAKNGARSVWINKLVSNGQALKIEGPD